MSVCACVFARVCVCVCVCITRLHNGTIGLSLSYLFSTLNSTSLQRTSSRTSHSVTHTHNSPLGGYSVRLSMLELYNEQLKDLLAATTGHSPPHLQLIDDSSLGIRVQGLAGKTKTNVCVT